MKALLASVEPDGQQCRVAIVYFDEVNKVTITDAISAPDMNAVKAIARQRAAQFDRNAKAVEILKASVGQEIDLTEPASEANPARAAYFTAKQRYSLIKHLVDDGLPVEGLDEAKADRDAKYKPEYEDV